jgi:hypothetical protein
VTAVTELARAAQASEMIWLSDLVRKCAKSFKVLWPGGGMCAVRVRHPGLRHKSDLRVAYNYNYTRSRG